MVKTVEGEQPEVRSVEDKDMSRPSSVNISAAVTHDIGLKGIMGSKKQGHASQEHRPHTFSPSSLRQLVNEFSDPGAGVQAW